MYASAGLQQYEKIDEILRGVRAELMPKVVPVLLKLKPGKASSTPQSPTSEAGAVAEGAAEPNAKGQVELSTGPATPQGEAHLAAAAQGHVAPASPRLRQKRRGRKPSTDAKADKRVSEAWASGGHKTYVELGRELGMSRDQVKQAIDRHRKRQRT